MQTGDLENHVWNAQDCCTRAQLHDNSGKECPTVSVVVLAQQQQLHWQRNRKTGDQTHRVKGCGLFQSQGNGSCRMQQFVIPGICRHQTTYELTAHFRLLNFAIGGEEIKTVTETHQGSKKTTERDFESLA